MNLPPWLILDYQDTSAQPGAQAQPTPPSAPSSTGETQTGTGTSQTPPAPKEQADGGGFMMIVLFGGMFVLLWFFLLGPERRRKKEHQARLASLKEKDRIMTMGGIFGTILRIEGDTVSICIDEKSGTKMKIARSAVSSILSEEAEPEKP